MSNEDKTWPFPSTAKVTAQMAELHLQQRLAVAQRLADALEKIADETAATWVSDVARAALAEWEALK